MSYILDALRRAEAERERGAVPGLHDQPFNPSSTEGEARAPARRGLWIAIGGVLLVMLAALAGYALRSDPQPMSVAQSAPAAAPPTAAAPEPAPPVAMRSQEPPLRQTAPQPAPSVAAVPVQRPAYIDAPPPEPKPLPRKPPADTAAASSPASGAKPSTEPRVFAMSELPDNIRRELPKLTMGGAMYSDSPASRMVIVNGQVLHEGDKLSGDLSLVKIQLKAAVFAYKGYRYEVAY